ncbi:SMR family transporter [Ferrimonas sp. YFM]|uniref:SMR family transporter n=1 Tax=Ferrimonas sp. YFM TaxID=3028878 RepID=UPI00257435F0|nr:SMR family transporter [Ferrimonas sp. YFM]
MFLILAVATEVAGTSMMSVMDDGVAKYLSLYLLIGCSYFFLARAARRIAIGVAYAVWEGAGLALITLFSVVALGQTVTLPVALGLGGCLLGLVMVNLGEVTS